MNFELQIKNFNSDYKKIKHEIKVGIKKNKLVFGSGGSANVIVLNDDFVLKIIPKFINNNLKKQKNNDELEAEHYRIFTEQFILKNITPHFVGLFKKYTLEDVKFIFPNKCLSLDEKIKLPFDKKDEGVDRLCDLKTCYYRQTLEKKASILVLENCPTSIGEQIATILKTKDFNLLIHNLVQIMRRVIFQVIFSLSVVTDKYPYFIHNDFFLRNILAVDENSYDPGDYVQYNYKSKSYYIPANGIYIKINDFGYSLNVVKQESSLVSEISQNPFTAFELKNNKRDIYSFLYDLYDGNGLGANSIKMLINIHVKNKDKRKKILGHVKKEIGKYLDYKTIDKYNKYNKNVIDWTWSIGESKILMNTVKKPNEYFKTNSFDTYTKLPDNGRVVKIFN